MKKYKHWMIRTDYDGESFGGFRWNPIGEWTEAPDWNPKPVGGGGLHGQGKAAGLEGFGWAQPGTRFVFCEVDPKAGVVVVNGDKIKVRRARIMATGKDAFDLLYGHAQDFPGSFDLRECEIPEGTKFPRIVMGSLTLYACVIRERTQFPEAIYQALSLESCAILEGVEFPETVKRSICFERCTFPEDMKIPEIVDGSLVLKHCTLDDRFKFPHYIGGTFYLHDCILLEGVVLPETVKGEICVQNCTIPECVDIPETAVFLDIYGCIIHKKKKS